MLLQAGFRQCANRRRQIRKDLRLILSREGRHVNTRKHARKLTSGPCGTLKGRAQQGTAVLDSRGESGPERKSNGFSCVQAGAESEDLHGRRLYIYFFITHFSDAIQLLESVGKRSGCRACASRADVHDVPAVSAPPQEECNAVCLHIPAT
jgi:hypothetical protein